MKFNERELQWQNKQLEGFYANESSLTNQNEPHASYNPSQADGFAGHVQITIKPRCGNDSEREI